MTSDGQGNSFVYDEENRLIEADTPGNSSLAKVVSVYDGLSRRVEKRAYDASGNLLSTTRYLYDGLLPIAEADANNVIQRTYTRGLDLSGTMQGAGGIGGLLALTDGTGSYSVNNAILKAAGVPGNLADKVSQLALDYYNKIKSPSPSPGESGNSDGLGNSGGSGNPDQSVNFRRSPQDEPSPSPNQPEDPNNSKGSDPSQPSDHPSPPDDPSKPPYVPDPAPCR